MRTVGYYGFAHACETDCIITYKVIAPIYIQNSRCSLLWKKSSLLKDNQLWQQVSGKIEGLTFTQTQLFRGVEIKVLDVSVFSQSKSSIRPVLYVEFRSRRMQFKQ